MTNIKQKNGNIIFSIDTLSIVYENASINDILKSLQLDDKYCDGYEGVLLNSFCTSLGYSVDLRFSLHGVGFQLRMNDLKTFYPSLDDIQHEDPDLFFQTKFPYCRVDAMGTPLDNLRSLGINVEQIVFNPLNVPSDVTYHFTRCDFAFDLFDHQPAFIDDLIGSCNDIGVYGSTGLTCPIGYHHMGVSFRIGDQKTILFGKGRSDRCLRIYDKLLEQTRHGTLNIANFKFYKQLGRLPQSWIRIELQVRREKTCHQIIECSHGDSLRVFRYIYDNFALRSGFGRDVPVADVWVDLFDWEVIPAIIQNVNCVELYVDPVVRSRNYIYSVALTSLITVLANDGYDSLRNYINDCMGQWQSDPAYRDKWNRLFKRLINPMDPPRYLNLNNQNGLYFI